mmetsp:Transcript_4080/g.10209  ORF Transcript_4080/g.10209 Transcript_4080/m.10209 type:complete len:222 (+) Transcript_4080:457-1122(+)
MLIQGLNAGGLASCYSSFGSGKRSPVCLVHQLHLASVQVVHGSLHQALLVLEGLEDDGGALAAVDLVPHVLPGHLVDGLGVWVPIVPVQAAAALLELVPALALVHCARACARHRHIQAVHQHVDEPGERLARQRGLHGAARRVAQHHDHLDAQLQHRVLQRRNLLGGRDVAGDAAHKHVAKALVKQDLGGHARVGTPQDGSDGLLLGLDLLETVKCLVGVG